MKKANRDLDSAMLSSRGLAFVATELCTKLHYVSLTKMKEFNYVTLCYKKPWLEMSYWSTENAQSRVKL